MELWSDCWSIQSDCRNREVYESLPENETNYSRESRVNRWNSPNLFRLDGGSGLARVRPRPIVNVRQEIRI